MYTYYIFCEYFFFFCILIEISPNRVFFCFFFVVDRIYHIYIWYYQTILIACVVNEWSGELAIERLHSQRKYCCLLLVCPAGFGKLRTTVEWVRENYKQRTTRARTHSTTLILPSSRTCAPNQFDMFVLREFIVLYLYILCIFSYTVFPNSRRRMFNTGLTMSGHYVVVTLAPLQS